MELRIFIIEPDGLRRRLISESAEEVDGLTVIGAAASLHDTSWPGREPPDLVLVESSLVEHEQEALVEASAELPDTRFVLFGSSPNLDALLGSVHLPVRGFLSYNHLATEEFSRSLQVIAHGGAVIEPISAQLLLQYLQGLHVGPQRPGTMTELTLREEEVLELVRQGLSNKEIALSMQISLGTVRAHLRSIFRKLDVTSRAGAAAIPTRTRRYGQAAS
jgi:DNA-binding NarL/FixJ family response regulator